MRGLQLLLTGVLLGSLAAFGWVYAQGNEGSGTLTGGDLAEIHHLHSLYNQGSDFGNAERWVNVFTEDGIFRISSGHLYVSPLEQQLGHHTHRKWERHGAGLLDGL